MKSIHISRMERIRSINLRIGFAAAFVLAILAFNWSSERVTAPSFGEEETWNEVPLKPFVISEPRPPEIPPSTLLKPQDLIIEVPNLVVSTLLPSLVPTDTSAIASATLGNTEPALPPTAGNAPPPPRETDPAVSPIFKLVEEMPRFPGCEDLALGKEEKYACSSNKMLEFIYNNIRYPELARQNGIEGTVYIQFVVEKDGSITGAKIVREIGGGCGEEALRVVSKMPIWQPGRQQGNPVRVQFSLPVKYKLGK
jgi:protein TonB